MKTKKKYKFHGLIQMISRQANIFTITATFNEIDAFISIYR